MDHSGEKEYVGERTSRSGGADKWEEILIHRLLCFAEHCTAS